MQTMTVRGTEIELNSETSTVSCSVKFFPSGGISAFMDSSDSTTCTSILNYLTTNNYVEVHVEKTSARTYAHLVSANGDVEHDEPVNSSLITLTNSLLDRIEVLHTAYENYQDSLSDEV